VGDYCSVQLFKCEGIFLQRIGGKGYGREEGEFHDVLGICIVRDRMYVSDWGNKRIQVFGKMTSNEIENARKERDKTKANGGCVIT